MFFQEITRSDFREKHTLISDSDPKSKLLTKFRACGHMFPQALPFAAMATVQMPDLDFSYY